MVVQHGLLPEIGGETRATAAAADIMANTEAQPHSIWSAPNRALNGQYRGTSGIANRD
jgi:hypothetical protein